MISQNHVNHSNHCNHSTILHHFITQANLHDPKQNLVIKRGGHKQNLDVTKKIIMIKVKKLCSGSDTKCI